MEGETELRYALHCVREFERTGDDTNFDRVVSLLEKVKFTNRYAVFFLPDGTRITVNRVAALAQYLRAQAKLRADESADVLDLLQSSVRMDPTSHRAHVALVQFHLKREDYAHAFQVVYDYERQFPDNAEAIALATAVREETLPHLPNYAARRTSTQTGETYWVQPSTTIATE